MTSNKTLVSMSICLSVILGIIAFLASDWMWLIIDILCVIMLAIPFIKNLGYRYNRTIIVMSMVAPIIAMVIHCADYVANLHDDTFLDVDIYTYLTAAVQTYQCYLIGSMLAVLMDRSFGMRMTKMWMIVFALAFAMTLSALDMFFVFSNMYVAGYPVFNEDFFDADRYTNGILMATPVVSTAVTAVLAVYVTIAYRGRSKDIFIEQQGHLHRHGGRVMKRPRIQDIVSMAVGVILISMAFLSPEILEHNVRITIICGLICFIPFIIRCTGAFTIPLFLNVLIVVSAFFHAFGLAINIYAMGGFYDTITHTLSSMTVSICIFMVLACFQHYAGDAVNFSGRGLALFTALLGMTFSVYWEVIEYCSDMITGSVTQYSPYDTLTDLVCDFLGNIIASVFVGIYMSRRSPKDLVESFEIHPKIKFLAFTDRTGKE